MGQSVSMLFFLAPGSNLQLARFCDIHASLEPGPNTRRQTAFYNLARIDCDNCFTIAIPRMKVWRRMIVVIHRYDDSQEPTDLGQSIAPWLFSPSVLLEGRGALCRAPLEVFVRQSCL